MTIVGLVLTGNELVKDYMTPREHLIVGGPNTTLSSANDLIWDNKLNTLPVVDENDHLQYLVFRKDYDSHKEHPYELLDKEKRLLVGAGINSRDYAERIPALVAAGVRLCSLLTLSEGYFYLASRDNQVDSSELWRYA